MRPFSGGNSRRSLVGGATCQKTPIVRSTLDKNPMPGHHFEGNPVDEGTTEGLLKLPCIVQKNPQVLHTARQVECHPVNNSIGKQSSFPPHKTRPDSPVPTLQGPCHPSQKWRGNLRFLPQPEMRPSSIKTNPVESREATPISTVSLTSHRHSEKLLEATGKRRGK